jgi:predicted AlkP superfamily phosphohydrolase/phosphomutase
MSEMRRTVLIGVDGATFDLIRPWVVNGDLPNFSAIANDGVEGVLESVVPTQSVPAWPSFNSGKNPGKHGLFAFNEDVKKEGELVDSFSLPSDRFWNILAAEGITPGVVGSLMSYPLRDLERGFEVTGPMTPGDAEVFTAPTDIAAEIRELVPDYSFGPELSGDRTDIQQACLESVDNRATVSRHLMTEREWDYYSVLFIATDRVQHKLWETPEMIRPVYEQIDEFVGWVRGEFPDANVILISDHGFTAPAERDFFLNKWLADRGDNSGSSPSLKYDLSKRSYSLIRQVLGINLRKFLPSTVEEWIVGTDDNADRPPIRAAGDTHFDGVYVSEELDDYEAVRDSIIEDLLTVEDPQSGRQVVRAAWKREEQYSGEWLSEIPDIVILPYPEFNVNANPYSEQFGTFPGMENEGTHDAAPDGILLAAGPDIACEPERTQASLLDVPPTILHLFDTAVPTDFDGSVLTGLLDGEAADRPVEQQSPIHYDGTHTAEVGARDDVEDRLENLGYL